MAQSPQAATASPKSGPAAPTQLAVPVVSSASPSSGPVAGGTIVVLAGSGFTGATAVTFGGVAATALTVTSDTSITCTNPAHAAGAVPVNVTTPGGSGAATVFTYLTVVPVVTGVSPNSGVPAGGTAVTISGSGFTGATAATFGGIAATALVVVNDATITCTTPAQAAGAVDVGVTTAFGTGTGISKYLYTETAQQAQLAIIANQTELLTAQAQWVRKLEDQLNISPPGATTPGAPPVGSNLDNLITIQTAAIRTQIAYASHLEEIAAATGIVVTAT